MLGYWGDDAATAAAIDQVRLVGPGRGQRMGGGWAAARPCRCWLAPARLLMLLRRPTRLPCTGPPTPQDGWIRTGDLALLDAQGYCSVSGRMRDVVIRGGENIYPR